MCLELHREFRGQGPLQSSALGAGGDSVSESVQSPGNVSICISHCLLFKAVNLSMKWRNTAPDGEYDIMTSCTNLLIHLYSSALRSNFGSIGHLRHACGLHGNRGWRATISVLKPCSCWFRLSLHMTDGQGDVTQRSMSGLRVWCAHTPEMRFVFCSTSLQ